MLLPVLALDVLVLSGGIVHTEVPGQEPFPATVVIEDGRIRSIVPEEAGAEPPEVPEDAERVDVDGLHLVPGLIDALVNFDPEHDALYLSSGITLVRDIGNFPGRVLTVRDPAHRDRTPGPAVLTAGVVLDGPGSPSSEGYVVESSEDVAHVIPNLKSDDVDADFVCIQHRLAPDVWRQVCDLAHQYELAVWGPIPTAVTREDVPGVQDGIFYLDALLPAGVAWSFVQPGAFAETATALAEAGTGVVPLLIGTGYRLRNPVVAGGQEALDRLSPYYESWWLEELTDREKVIRQLGQEEYIKQGSTVLKKQLALVKQLHEAGVRLVPGSAAPNPWLSPGWGLHDELALFAEAGLPASDVLALATREAAEALGVGDERGTLEPGKVADLLVVSGDPCEDLSLLRRPAGVVVRGRLLPSGELVALEQAEVRRQGKAREELRKPLDVPAPTLPEGEVLLQGEVETMARGLRISAEHWAVVQLPDDKRAYCSRMLTPGDGVFEDADLSIRQVTKNGKLEEFEIDLRQGDKTLVARGLWVAQSFRVERRLDGAFLKNDSMPRRPLAVALGSVTTLLMIVDAAPTKTFPVLDMRESLEPVVVDWEMLEPQQAERDDGTFATVQGVRTHQQRGGMLWEMAPDGSVRLWETHLGDNVSRTRPVVRAPEPSADAEHGTTEAAASGPAASETPEESASDSADGTPGDEPDEAGSGSGDEPGPGSGNGADHEAGRGAAKGSKGDAGQGSGSDAPASSPAATTGRDGATSD